jgi:DNA-binding FadR family transcriptional regulator
MRATADLVEELDRLFRDGTFPEGSQLPTERDLATRFGVTRTAVRRALAALEADGKLWRHRGKGTFAGAPPSADPSPADLSRSTNPAEIMEARLALEPSIAALAAVHATNEDISRIRQCLAGSRRVTGLEEFESADARFHALIAESTWNRPLIAAFRMVNRLRDDRIWGRLKKASLTEARREAYIADHERCLTAIEQRLADEARAAMHEHLARVRQDLFWPHGATAA